VYTVLFVRSLSALNRRKRTRIGMHRLLVTTAVAMWVIASTHLGVNFTRIIEAFIKHKDDQGGPAAYFNRLSNFTNLFGSALYLAQTIIGDAFLLCRSTIVWGLDWRIIALPFLLFLCNVVSSIGILVSFSRAELGEVFREDLRRWIVVFFVTTLTTNLICTTLIATKIWKINSFTATHVFENKMRPAMLVILESGAIYSGTLFALLVAYLVKSWSQYLIVDAVSPIVGIVFSMLILQLGRHFSEHDGSQVQPVSHDSTLWTANPRRSGVKLQVAVDRSVHVEMSGNSEHVHNGMRVWSSKIDDMLLNEDSV